MFAISRAKDCFLVFGNMAIFDQDKDTPVGNLAKWLFDSPDNELSNGFVYDREEPLNLDCPTERLCTLEKHREVLHQAFEMVQRCLLIVSPFISIKAIQDDDIEGLIRACRKRGVSVCVYTDDYLDLDLQNRGLKDVAYRGRQVLRDSGAEVIELHGIHSKTLAIDRSVLIEGSFNWLSASREASTGRYEASMLISGDVASKYINDLVRDLNRMLLGGTKSLDQPGLQDGDDVVVGSGIKKKLLKRCCSDGFGKWSKTPELLDSSSYAVKFFSKPLFNRCTFKEIQEIQDLVNGWEICKKGINEEIRKCYPRHMQKWQEEEDDVLQVMMRKTNDLSLFVSCLQRKENAIIMRINHLMENSDG